MYFLLDAVFAAGASIGFAAVSHPPRKAFLPIAILAAVGHASRALLMRLLGFDIAGASFFAALLMGFGSYFLGRRVRTPMTVLYIPALLPMIPGMYAYRAVLSLVMFTHHHAEAAVAAEYMHLFLTNTTITVTTVFAMGVGSTLPTFLLSSRAYSMTRPRRRKRSAGIAIEQDKNAGRV